MTPSGLTEKLCEGLTPHQQAVLLDAADPDRGGPPTLDAHGESVDCDGEE